LLFTVTFAVAGYAEPTLQLLHNHVRSVVSGGQAVPVGLLPPTQRLNLAITLPLRNPEELTSLLDRLYDPTAPDYHRFLSVAQFTDSFGASEDDYQAVVEFARANGFTVTDTPANRRLVDISGTVAQIESAFHVVMMIYRHPTENRTFFSPDREPSLDLQVPVSHIAGLNNFSLPQPKFKRLPEGEPIQSHAGSGPGGAYLGGDMRAAYYGGTALTGTGQSVGLCEFDGYNLSDVTSTLDGKPNSVPINNVLIDGASGGSDGDDGEQVLDIVQAATMAPGMSQVRVYIAPGTTSIGVGDTDMFNKMATENIVKQIGCSWGWNPDDTSSDDPIFQEFAAQGQNMFVASGDAGAYTGSNATDQSYPAESVYVVAVGGTDLTTNGAGGSWASETAWLDSSGGPSDNGFAIPSWQSGIANSSNGASSTIRDLPDVAAEANFDNYVCDQGSCSGTYGGTSFAAPRWAGFLALVNQQVVSNGGSTLGFLNPALYAIGKGSSYTTDFHDITSGNNNNGKGKSYNAVTGYDLVTGWGSPNGQNMINALAGSTTPGFTLSAAPSSLTITQGGAAGTSTITVSAAGGFTGSVTLSASGLPSGVTASFNPASTTSTSTLSLTASGTATLGTATVTIKGTSASLVSTTTLALTVSSSSGAQTAVYSSTLKAPECATVGSSCDSGPTLLNGRDHMSGGAEPNQPNTINNACADGTSGTYHSDESNDRIVITSSSGSLTHATSATVTATVWAYSGYSSDALDLYYAANANSPSWVFIKTIVPTKAGVNTLSATFTLPTGALQAVRAQFRYLGSASSCTTGSYNDHDDLIFAVQ
jgi:subtilase family serine protease